jgi:hypothetical protein
MRRFLVAIVVVCVSVRVYAAEAVIKLKLANNQLTVTASPEAFVAGDSIRLEVANAGPVQASHWTFTVGGSPMVLLSGNDVVFTGTVPSEEGAITFEDSTQAVDFPGGIRLLFAQTSGATRPPGRLRPYESKRDIVRLYFDTNGFPLQKMPRDIDDNDTITVFIDGTVGDTNNMDVVIEGNVASGDSFDVVGQGNLGALKDVKGNIQGTGAAAFRRLEFNFPPYASPSIVIKINKSNQTIRQHTVRINKTYVAAFRLMSANSDIRFNDFKVSKQSGKDGTFIENASDPQGQTRYFLTVVPFLWNWRGRDVLKPAKIERINPVIGFGLKDSSREMFVGVSVEITRALDVVYGWHHARVKTLGGGYKEGDAFTGDLNTLPTVERSKSEWLFGVSLDLRIATQIFSNLLQ